MTHLRGITSFGLSLAALLAPVAATAAPAPTAISLPGARLHPESVSITPDGTAYIGSMTGGVLRLSLPDGQAVPWIAPGAYGSGALFGVLADRRHGLLWTCTNSFPFPGTVVSGADAGHWLKAFDLHTGAGRISLPLPGDKAICNDIAVGPDGAVYVTDTGQPHILRWKPGARALEIWADNPLFEAKGATGGLDGLAFAADGQLYLNNVRDGSIYRQSIRQDGSAGPATRLELSRSLQNPDGMRPLAPHTPGSIDLIVAESVGRIARLSIRGDQVEVTTLATEGHPTGVDTYAGTAWYVEAWLDALFRPDKVPPPPLPFRLSPVSLKH